MNKFFTTVLIIAVFTAIPFFAVLPQWSNNASTNLKICDVAQNQTYPEVAITSDGGCYISWFDDRLGNYDFYLQRLNSNGVKQFDSLGLLISNHTQSGTLYQYDLKTDDNDNAIIVFCDIRAGGQPIPYAYKISPTGSFLWGIDGIALSDSANIMQLNPNVTKTSDGNFVFAWSYYSTNSKIALQKLNTSGIRQWGNSPMKISGSVLEKYDMSNLVASDNGSIILMWCGYTDSLINPQNFKYYTQKFSSGGTRVWNSTQDTVYSLGGYAQEIVNISPQVISDKNNGAIFCWTDKRPLSIQIGAYIQRVTSSGTFLFPANGTKCSLIDTSIHLNPNANINSSTNEIFVFWIEANSLQSLYGIYGQRFSSSGARMWVGSGKIFKPLDQNSTSDIDVFVKDTNVIVHYDINVYGSSSCHIKAFLTGSSGAFGWFGGPIEVSSKNSSKNTLSSGITNSGMSILAWGDDRKDIGGIYAQNINYNGNIGPVSVRNIGTGIVTKYELEQNYPNPFNQITNIKFQITNKSDVSLRVYDVSGREVATLVNEEFVAGSYLVRFDAESLASGVYFYRLQAGDFTDTRKLILLK
jgi:hypothetical protein